jgi:hypothetical protein
VIKLIGRFFGKDVDPQDNVLATWQCGIAFAGSNNRRFATLGRPMPLIQLDGDCQNVTFNAGTQIYQIGRFWQFSAPSICCNYHFLQLKIQLSVCTFNPFLQKYTV